MDFVSFSNVQLRQYFPFRINYTKYLISCRSLINGFGFIFTGSLKQTKQNETLRCLVSVSLKNINDCILILLMKNGSLRKDELSNCALETAN